MKPLYRIVCVLMILFTLTACSNGDYKVISPLDKGSIQIEYKGIVYTESGSFNGDPPGEKVFNINYNEVCETVAYDAYLDGNTMYLKGRQPFWADPDPVNFILTAGKSSETNKPENTLSL